MVSAVADVAPLAIALVLVNPIPVMAVIVKLSSPRARLIAPIFALGWLIGMTAALALLLFVISSGADVGSERDPTPLASLVRLLLGLALLVMAVRRWQGRPRPGEAGALPAWVAKLDQASPAAAAGLGVFLAGINPKNLAFNAAAALAIAQADLTVAETLLPAAVFILLASVGIVVPVIWYFVAREQATSTLAAWRDWLAANYATMMAVVFVLFGVVLVSKGLGDLFG